VNQEICLDANVVVKWFLPEELRDQATALAEECQASDVRMIAPEFVYAEVSSAVRRRVYRELLLPAEGLLAVGLLMSTPITPYDARYLYRQAWRIAETYQLPTLYDAYYLALSELRECVFWTADERLVNSVPGLSYVRNLKDYIPGSLKADT
jgi:predicted nucleic acid-binding protein